MQVSKIKAFSALLLAGCIASRGAAADPQCQSITQPKLPVPHKSEAPAPLLPKSATDTKDRPFDFSAESFELDRDGHLDAKNAGLTQDDYRISAEDLEYDQDTGNFRARGWVRYDAPLLKVQGKSAAYDREIGTRFGNARFELPAKPARGSADEIVLLPTGRLTLDRVNYTSCPADDPDWMLKAKTLSLDNATRNGTGRNVRLDFKGIPILYTPFISFPLGNERKSGFLFPDFGHSNRGGIELSVPYYFNLAPNMDLTLTPHVLTRRGLGLDEEFRYLTQRQRGTVVGHFLPNDNLRDSDRSLVEWLHQADFASNWRLTVDAANASDQNYFEDFGLGTEGASITYLERTAELNHYGRHWNLLAQVQNFQTIDQNIPDAARPYSRLPRFVGRGEWSSPSLGFDYSLDSELVYFYRSTDPGAGIDDITGTRVDVMPQISWSFTRPGLYITPSAAYRQTNYQLAHLAPGADDAPERGAPIGSLDAGMIFERTAGRKANRVQTLEPRLLYLYVPYRDQTDLPVFDTGLPDLNLVQLFRRNRYVGADRLSDANQVSMGVTSRLLDADDGRQLISATVGQTYYFDSPRVTLPGEVPFARNTSNFISQVALTAYRNWNINVGHEWNHATSQSEKTELAVQYRPGGEAGGNKVINAGYRFRRDLIEQVDASAAWPIAQRWNVYARGVYSLRDDALIEQFAGFEYNSCCWKLRLVQRRYVSDRTGERDSSVAIQLELKGLGSVGVPIDAFLQRSIRGYFREPAR